MSKVRKTQNIVVVNNYAPEVYHKDKLLIFETNMSNPGQLWTSDMKIFYDGWNREYTLDEICLIHAPWSPYGFTCNRNLISYLGGFEGLIGKMREKLDAWKANPYKRPDPCVIIRGYMRG